jgi:hypothetical protein
VKHLENQKHENLRSCVVVFIVDNFVVLVQSLEYCDCYLFLRPFVTTTIIMLLSEQFYPE